MGSARNRSLEGKLVNKSQLIDALAARYEGNRKAAAHAIDFPFVVQPGWRLSKEYGIFATPVAFLIDEEGLIAREVAKGGPEILSLAQGALAAGREAHMA